MVTVVVGGEAVVVGRSTLLHSPYFAKIFENEDTSVCALDRDADLFRQVVFFLRYLQLPASLEATLDARMPSPALMAFFKDIDFLGLGSILTKVLPELRRPYVLTFLPPFVRMHYATCGPIGSCANVDSAVVELASSGGPRYILLEGRIASGCYTFTIKARELRDEGDSIEGDHIDGGGGGDNVPSIIARGVATASMLRVGRERGRLLETLFHIDLWRGCVEGEPKGPLAALLRAGAPVF